MTASYAPAELTTLLGEPSMTLIEPQANGLPWQARVRLGSHVATVEDPAYCRAVAQTWLEAANGLDAAAYARRRVAAQLAPLNPAAPVDDASGAADTTLLVPLADGTVIHLDATPPLADRPCAKCQFGNHDLCRLTLSDDTYCPCADAGHPLDDAETAELEQLAEEQDDDPYCGDCGDMVALTKAGRFRKHADGLGSTCPGSGTVPQ
jgi:hypothetical protein